MKHFERSLPMMLYRTLDTVMPAFRQIFSEFGLTEQQWRVLRVLWEHPDGIALLELADLTLILGPSLVGVVDRLSRNGLVERRRSQADRRIVYIHATAAGRQLQERVTPLVDAAYARLEKSIDPELWRQMYVAMDQLVANSPPSAGLKKAVNE